MKLTMEILIVFISKTKINVLHKVDFVKPFLLFYFYTRKKSLQNDATLESLEIYLCLVLSQARL